MTTPAEELRTAAQKIRATAAVTISGPWNIDGPWWHNDTAGEAAHATGLVSAGTDRRVVALAVPGKPRSESSLAHIALWDPIVAAAVADWLTDWADLDPSERETRCGMCGVDHALQVAAAINTKAGEPVVPTAEDLDFDRQMLAFAVDHDIRDELFWQKDGEGGFTWYVICSDTFHYACADVEPVTQATLPALRQAIEDERAATEPLTPVWGLSLYVARQRGMRPIAAAYPKDERLRPLFDACGPARDVPGKAV